MTQDPEPKHPHNRKDRNPSWGGRRPGAGAPKGNLNALKHGRRSRQFAEIGALIAEVPGVGQNLRALAGRRDTKRRRDEESATQAIIAIYAHAKDIAAGRDSPGPCFDRTRD
jgi:hypothetical protein